MLVAPVIGKDGDGALVMKPLVVGDDIIGRIPQVDLPRPHRDGEFATMGDKLSALLGVGRVGRVANGQFQAQFRVEIGGFEVEIAKDFLFLVGVLGFDVDTDFGLQVRRHFGAAAHELAACVLAQMTPFDA